MVTVRNLLLGSISTQELEGVSHLFTVVAEGMETTLRVWRIVLNTATQIVSYCGINRQVITFKMSILYLRLSTILYNGILLSKTYKDSIVYTVSGYIQGFAESLQHSRKFERTSILGSLCSCCNRVYCSW